MSMCVGTCLQYEAMVTNHLYVQVAVCNALTVMAGLTCHGARRQK